MMIIVTITCTVTIITIIRTLTTNIAVVIADTISTVMIVSFNVNIAISHEVQCHSSLSFMLKMRKMETGS